MKPSVVEIPELLNSHISFRTSAPKRYRLPLITNFQVFINDRTLWSLLLSKINFVLSGRSDPSSRDHQTPEFVYRLIVSALDS
jgi:hypothetical protein